jgi:two-component system, chemotaxis family, CheB/CheR fusion protein
MDTTDTQLVVVGSSAGGIEALSELVSSLPEDFPAPIVIAQHLDPEKESHLKDILSRRSRLPVQTVTDHEPLQDGVVFVVPANRHVNITDSEIGLSEDSAGRPMPSVDLLLSSAAEVYGERLVAVILTGTGSDGVEGARVVHGAGGTVIIQDPETAEFGAMPGALAPNTVDIVAGLDRIGPIIGDLLSGVEVSEGRLEAEERRGLERFLEELRGRHGVDFSSYKTPTIIRRLKRRMAATGSESIEEYTQYLDDRPEEYRQLVSSFLIKVTEFFRDPEMFAYLKEEVLPELLETARENGNQLRIWSAGCATGEEAYTLAILFSEVLGDEAGHFNVRIFATDIDDSAVNFARHGIYPPSALSNLSEEQIDRYFTREGHQYQIKKAIRSMIIFGEHDLARRSPFPHIDLVVSRNVLIYFTPELQRRVLQLFAYSLRDDGYLVLGKAESTSPFSEFFTSPHRQYKIYRRQGDRFLIPPTLPVSPAPMPRPRPERIAYSGGERASSEPQIERQRTSILEEGFLNQLPVGVVVVDRKYDIQAINNTARQLLSIHSVAIGEDFLHLLQSASYSEIRRAIDAAFRNGEHAHIAEFVVEDAASGQSSYLQINCHPQRAEDERGLAKTVVVVVSDVTEPGRARRELEEELTATRTEFESYRREAESEASRQKAQNERLIETNRHLEEANRELTDLNQELRIRNEESQLASEEAQAATEEVETLNEELQATNEELETLNEELQATIEELNTTNDDLQARTAELQDLARTREEERRTSEVSRRQLEAILLDMSDAVLAVDEDGEVLFGNAAFEETFGVRSGEAAELLGDSVTVDENGERLALEETPRARAARGESFEMRFAVDGEDGRRRLFQAKGRPMSDADAGGSVVVIREID